ncbi:CDP-glycerol glycerophosphotransferase family protein [Lacisediminihabitans sp.]|uniref:CDP-glycerol glycerophosphotransferase family protein n=1 Tax=Lacisediminihabitans sp. TaxID=2787631 RepID=UPI00374D1B80
MTRIERGGPPVGLAIVDSVTVLSSPAPTVAFAGSVSVGTPARLEVRGSRQTLGAPVAVAKGRWSASLPLLDSLWGGAALPPRSGQYEAILLTADGSPLRLDVDTDLPAPQLVEGVTRVAFDDREDGLGLRFSAPLSDRERGPLQQASLEADYRSATFEPIDAVFFESFYGQNASCNPLAIDRELARLRPDIARYWSVADASVAVPEGSIALIEGSEDWWRIRGSARLLVINDWLRKRFRKRSYQTVLQTWHGTMLKKLALSRLRLGARPALATLRERARWDILLAQNPYSTKVFRSAYAFLGPVWQEGYPRDDVLLTGDAAAVRRRLGIPDGVTVLLYAPTWRDDRPDHVDHLDVSRFAENLGAGYVTLIRGHSRTLLPGEDLKARNVLDVTGYPDISELFLVADALITDYSSVMFDFTVTGKPLFFFTPDLVHYREKLRGFYFDLSAVAPGPVVSDPAELVALVRDRDAVRARYADKYRAWQRRFNPRDDGGAAERVVRRLLEERIIG